MIDVLFPPVPADDEVERAARDRALVALREAARRGGRESGRASGADGAARDGAAWRRGATARAARAAGGARRRCLAGAARGDACGSPCPALPLRAAAAALIALDVRGGRGARVSPARLGGAAPHARGGRG